jgi:hypothetical protein
MGIPVLSQPILGELLANRKEPFKCFQRILNIENNEGRCAMKGTFFMITSLIMAIVAGLGWLLFRPSEYGAITLPHRR